MKVAVIGNVDAKILIAVNKLLEQKGLPEAHVIDSLPPTDTNDLIVFGDLEGLTKLKGNKLNDIENVELVHLFKKGERLSAGGYHYNVKLHKLDPKKRIVTQYLNTKITPKLEAIINIPYPVIVPHEVIRSMVDSAKNMGVTVEVRRNDLSGIAIFKTEVENLFRLDPNDVLETTPMFNIVQRRAHVNNFDIIGKCLIKEVQALHELNRDCS